MPADSQRRPTVGVGWSRGDFDIALLYSALDQRRIELGLTWGRVTHQINALFCGTPARPISASTITGMRTRGGMNGNGVLQMLLWLDATPEDFVAGPGTSPQGGPLRHVGPSRILRFDPRAIHAAVDAKRRHEGFTWQQVAADLGWPATSALPGLARGSMIGFPQLMRIFLWLERPAADFTFPSDL